MMYRYKKGFIPWWYTANISDKDFNSLKKCIAVLLIANMFFMPITIHRFQSLKSEPEDKAAFQKEINESAKPNKDLEIIKWFVKSKNYKESLCIYDDSGNCKISYNINDISLYKVIVNDLKESGIEYQHIDMEEADDGWKVEISF